MIFPCPLCGQKLLAADEAAGKRCRCTKCKSLVGIPAAAAGGGPPHPPPGNLSRAAQTQPSPPRVAQPRPVGPPRNVLAEELEDLIVERRQQLRQRAAAEAQQREETERRQRALQAKAQAAERSSAQSGGLPVFLTVVLASCGVMVLFCGGALGLLYWKRMPAATVLEVGGYQATAYGKKTDSRNDGTTQAKGTLSPTTGSEFWIASVQLPANAESGIEALKSRFSSAADSVEVVQRGELEGLKCTGIRALELGLFRDLQPEMEIFIVPDQLIFLTYVPGSHKQAAGLQPRALPLQRERRYDDPERFFASLRRADSQ